MTTAFGIVHNCAKAKPNQVILRKLRFIELAHPYTNTSQNASEIVISAVLAMSYVMEENETSLARLHNGKYGDNV